MPSLPALACLACGAPNCRRHSIRGTKKGGYDRRWMSLRARHLKQEPLCRICALAGKTVEGVIVDHITPINMGGGRLDPANLQTLCRQCHNRKIREDMR